MPRKISEKVITTQKEKNAKEARKWHKAQAITCDGEKYSQTKIVRTNREIITIYPGQTYQTQAGEVSSVLHVPKPIKLTPKAKKAEEISPAEHLENNFNVDELKTLADKAGVKYDNKVKKSVLINALVARFEQVQKELNKEDNNKPDGE